MTNDNHDHVHHYENWKTIAFSPLGDWINIYRFDDGDHWTTQCPGILLQECSESEQWWDETDSKTGKTIMRERTVTHERRTRAVYATPDEGTPELVAVDEDCSGGDYATSMPRSRYNDWMIEEWLFAEAEWKRHAEQANGHALRVVPEVGE